MTTFLNKLLGKNKKKALLPLDLHAERYLFDYGSMPSVAAYGSSIVFVDDDDKHELFYDFLKEFKNIPSLATSTEVKIYKIKDGQIAVFSFPDPEASPEIKYGICVFKTEQGETLHSNPYNHPNPYFILAKIADVWAIGEITPSPKESYNYITTYYELMDSPELLHFTKWVMKRESLTLEESEPITSPYLQF